MLGKQDIQALLPFTAHRVKIAENLWTIPEGGDDPFYALTTKVLLERAGGSLRGKRILDLGCLEGGYSAAFAQMGAREVIGIEARAKNFERCLLVKDCLRLKNLFFYKEDVKNVKRDWFGDFDIVFASGILYHLDDPYSFLKNISEMSLDFTLIDTHIARRDSWAHSCSEELIEKTFGAKKYIGREAFEFPKGLPQEEVESFLWSSYSNPTSFWLIEESLVNMFSHVGFNYISKVYVPRGYRCQENCKEECRTVVIAKKDWKIKMPFLSRGADL
jgi:SAM-dependent methyltransferase